MTRYRKKLMKKNVVPNKSGAFFIILAFVGVIITLFLVSAFDTDPMVSQRENRTLKQKPKFTLSAVFDGKYFSEFEEYYQDTFPLRDKFLDLNSKISDAFSKTGGNSGMVIVEKQEKDDFAGQNID